MGKLRIRRSSGCGAPPLDGLEPRTRPRSAIVIEEPGLAGDRLLDAVEGPVAVVTPAFHPGPQAKCGLIEAGTREEIAGVEVEVQYVLGGRRRRHHPETNRLRWILPVTVFG